MKKKKNKFKPGITVLGECLFKSFKTPILCHGSSDPCVKYTWATAGSKPPYISFVWLILFSNVEFSNLKTELNSMKAKSKSLKWLTHRRKYPGKVSYKIQLVTLSRMVDLPNQLFGTTRILNKFDNTTVETQRPTMYCLFSTLGCRLRSSSKRTSHPGAEKFVEIIAQIYKVHGFQYHLSHSNFRQQALCSSIRLDLVWNI